MSQIDWSKAPEGFPLWLEGLGDNAKHSGWHRRNGDVFEHERAGQFRAFREGQFFIVHSGPEQPYWTGEGLPPVGTTCEIFIKASGWYEALIKYIGKEVCVWQWVGKDASANDVEYSEEITHLEFRPIRTPERISAEARDKAIEQMVVDSQHPMAPLMRDSIFAELYDQGYRKFEIVENEE